jgi:hypothetical protein
MKNLENKIELDNILRGKNNILKGIMSKSIRTLEFLIETELQVSKVYLKVLSSNSHAVNFYEKIDYDPIDKIPLKSDNQNGKVVLIPGSPAEDYFIVMEKYMKFVII